MKNWIIKLSIALCLFSGNVLAQTASVPDTNLLKFLKKTYPFTIDVNGKLILSEASKVKGMMYCRSANITNLQGIEYFTSVNTLDFGFNAITQMPVLNSDSLQNLSLNDNQLTLLPDLSKTKKLTILDVAGNSLASLPNLNKLTSLKTLICKGNQLSAVPNLDSLPNLAALDVSFNKLTSMPKTLKTNTIQTFNLNDNLISSLPDSFQFDKLTKLFLYNNPLTFKELIKITTLSGYDSLILFSPQNTLNIGKIVTVKEGDTFTLSTSIDTGLKDVSYDWHKKGSLVKTVTNNLFTIENTTLSDSGKYTCQLRHPSFPSLVLYSDTFYVKVVSCPSPSKFSYTTTSISCNKAGSISIQNIKSQNVTYLLKSSFSGSVQTNTSGFFAGLTEPSYLLSFRNATGCERNYPNEIMIPKEECKQVLITPNGDGESDSYFFTQTGKVTIYDKRSASIKTFSIPGEWDGSSKNGRVSPGYYIADINNGEELITISVVY